MTGLVSVIDVLLVAYVNYRILKLVRGKRAWRIVVGIFVFVVALVASDYLQLHTLHWMLDKAALLAPVALVILFLPELRQAVEGFGRLGGWTERLISSQLPMESSTVQELCKAIEEMSEHRVGALIAIERSTSLQQIADTGIPVHARVTAPLIGAIFYHGNPLHDGAVVIRGDRVVSAACQLPMSDSDAIPGHYHMRHRAGIGMSENSDAIVLIVSEERGEISVAVEGELTVADSAFDLKELLERELAGQTREKKRRKKRRPKRRAEEVVKQ